jgi:hypothetical protein
VWDPVEIDTENAASWPDEISHEKRDGAGSGAEIQHAHARRNSAAFTNHPGRLSEYATLVIQSFEFSRSTSERILGTQRASSPCFKELHAPFSTVPCVQRRRCVDVTRLLLTLSA